MKLCQQYVLNLVKKYKDTIMCGRTHVIHALPITLGYKVAVWADELGRDIQRLEEIAKRVFVGQMSGAVGTLASQPEKGLETQKRMMEILELEQPTISWHVARDSQAEFVSTLALCAGTLGRMTAHSIVYRTCMKAYEEEAQMKDALMAEPEVTEAFTEDEIDYMLNPHNYIGLATQFADRVLEKYK
jgi:adenylosuccinate lyase